MLQMNQRHLNHHQCLDHLLLHVHYLVFVAAMWYVTGVYEFFLLLTSFNHYIRYISTFYVRRGIDFGSFKRDVLLFKTIALIQVFYQYFHSSLGIV